MQNLLQAEVALARLKDRPWDVSALYKMWEPIIQEAESLFKALETAEVETANDAIATSRAFGKFISIYGLKDLAMQEIETLKSSAEVLELKLLNL